VDVKQLQKQDKEERETHWRPKGLNSTYKRQANNKRKENTRYNYSLHISIGKCAAAAAGASNTCPN